MPDYAKVEFVKDGEMLTSPRETMTSGWWVVYVRSVGEKLGCVYGGYRDTALWCIDTHLVETGHPIEVTGYRFNEDGPMSLLIRGEIDEYYRTRDRATLARAG